MPHATIDHAKCKRDALCIKVCPMGILEPDPQNFPRLAEGKAQLCLHCGHCVAICGQAAIALDDLTPAACQTPRPELQVTPAQIAQYFKTRRSIRLYQNKKVARPALEQILDIARFAPTAKNGQPVEFLAIDDPAQLRHLSQLTIDFLRPNPALARLISAWDAGHDPVLRAAPLLLIAHAPTTSYTPVVDCTIALAHVDLLAASVGLGACWAGLLMAAAPGPLGPALHLPPNHAPYNALMLGYPQHPFARIPPRRELRVTWR